MTETIDDAIERRNEAATIFSGEDQTSGVLALRGDQTWWTARQAAALRSLGIKNATQEDLLVFFHYCQKTGLDPFKKQIYLLERKTWNKDAKQWEYQQTIQVGIDGFRANAQTAATRQGINVEYEDTVWFDASGAKHEVWLDRDTPPAAARVVIVKVLSDGTRLRVPGVALFEDYAAYGVKKDKDTQKVIDRWLQNQWAVMPAHMIEKCAEAFALRRAFPDDLSGIYVEEELQGKQFEPPKLKARQRDVQADDDDVVPGTVEPGTESNGASAEPSGAPQAGGPVPPDDPSAENAPPPVPTPRESAAKILAVFREHGLGSKETAMARRAVMTGILAAPPYTAYVDPAKMTPEAMASSAEQLAIYCDALRGSKGEKTQALLHLADQVTVAVTAHDQAEAEA
jgi:phage recombination protein Bet